MRRKRIDNGKIILAIAVTISFIALSIGFASFSGALNIAPTASVNPSLGTFNVVFSKSSETVIPGSIPADTTPTALTATGANLSGTTINGINISFTEPGQKAVYDFYVYNSGELDAYLKSITSGKIVCTPGEGSTPELVNNACNAISMKVEVGNKVSTSTKDIDGSIASISNHVLPRKSAESIKITIEYASLENAHSDGQFTVILPTISLSYNSVD